MSNEVRSPVVNLPPRPRGSLLKKLGLWALAILALYAIVGFLVLPPILKSVLTRQLSERLHRQAAIQKIRTNPFLLTVEVKGFLLQDRVRSTPFVSFQELFLDLELASLIKGGPVLREIRLTEPRVMIIRNEDGTYNFSDLLEEFAARPAPAPASKPYLFSLNNIQIVGGSIDFDDRPKHARHTVVDLNFAIPFVSDLPYYLDVYVQPAFQAKVNGTPIALAGKTKPFIDSRETTLEINVSDFDIPTYLEYVPVPLRFKILSGTLDTKLSLSFTQYRDKPPALIVTGKADLKKLSVTDLAEHPLLNLPLLDFAVDSIDVFSKKVNLASVLIQSPTVHLRRDKTGALNMMALIPEQQGETSPKSDKAEGARPSIEAAEVRLADGTVSFSDDSLEKPFQTTLQAINVVVRHFSTAPAKTAAIEASLRTDAGETLKHNGTLTLEPLAAEGAIELSRLPVKRYAPYYAKNFLFDVDDAVLDLSTRYAYTAEHTILSALATTLSSVRLKKKGEKEPFLKVPTLSVKETDLDLGKRTLAIGEVSTHKGTLSVMRESDGTLNLGTLMAPAPAPGGDKAPASGAGPTKAKEARAEPSRSAPVQPWIVSVKKLAVDRYAVKLEDRVPTQAATFVADPISLTAENLSTRKNSTGKAALRLTLNKTGALAVNGSIGVSPIAANLSVDVKDIDLIPLQPYFTDKIKILVTGGAVGANGTLTVKTNQEDKISTGFTGQAALLKLSTVDKANSEDFLKWDSLSIGGINAGTNPFHVEIQEIALTDFYSRLIVNPDGTLNVQGIVQREPTVQGEPKDAAKVETEARPDAPVASQTPAPPAPQEAKPIKIDMVTLQGGSISFSDQFIKPTYSANLTQLAGRVSGMSSEESQQADVDVRGRLDNQSPLEITGKINPLSKDLFVDLKVDFKDIELSPMTPYSVKYAGYTIQKGKLTLSLKYLIAKRKLEAETKVFLDEFTFGEKVDSPDATRLPVRFAVSLLKDRKGEINLDLPVTGSLDDPKFSVWGVIGKVLTNLLTKAATAPFALLGSLVGGGEELSHVEFEYGKSDLDGPAQARLQTLAKALYERPALKLDVAGHVDPAKDQEALRQERFERKIKAQKLEDLLKKGAVAVPLDTVKVEPAEYPKYLAMAYKKETFPKPRNLVGMAKDLPAPEMEKLMLAHIQITDDDLRQLAIQRGQRAKDYLVQAGKIESERIFLVEPGAAPAREQKDHLKESRVDFAIK